MFQGRRLVDRGAARQDGLFTLARGQQRLHVDRGARGRGLAAARVLRRPLVLPPRGEPGGKRGVRLRGEPGPVLGLVQGLQQVVGAGVLVQHSPCYPAHESAASVVGPAFQRRVGEADRVLPRPGPLGLEHQGLGVVGVGRGHGGLEAAPSLRRTICDEQGPRPCRRQGRGQLPTRGASVVRGCDGGAVAAALDQQPRQVRRPRRPVPRAGLEAPRDRVLGCGDVVQTELCLGQQVEGVRAGASLHGPVGVLRGPGVVPLAQVELGQQVVGVGLESVPRRGRGSQAAAQGRDRRPGISEPGLRRAQQPQGGRVGGVLAQQGFESIDHRGPVLVGRGLLQDRHDPVRVGPVGSGLGQRSDRVVPAIHAIEGPDVGADQRRGRIVACPLEQRLARGERGGEPAPGTQQIQQLGRGLPWQRRGRLEPRTERGLGLVESFQGEQGTHAQRQGVDLTRASLERTLHLLEGLSGFSDLELYLGTGEPQVRLERLAGRGRRLAAAGQRLFGLVRASEAGQGRPMEPQRPGLVRRRAQHAGGQIGDRVPGLDHQGLAQQVDGLVGVVYGRGRERVVEHGAGLPVAAQTVQRAHAYAL